MMEALCTTRTGMPAARARSSRSVCVVALLGAGGGGGLADRQAAGQWRGGES